MHYSDMLLQREAEDVREPVYYCHVTRTNYMPSRFVDAVYRNFVDSV